MFYTRFLSPTDQKYAESSTYWQFLDYRPPVNFDRYTLKCDAKNSTSLSLYIYIHIYHPLDNRYGFSFSIGNTKNDHVATSTCLEWQLKYINVSIILASKLTSHACALQIDNVDNYLYLNNGSFKFEVDPHQFNLSLHHFSQFQRKGIKNQKLADLWLAGEMVNRIGIYGSNVAEGLSAFQRRSCCLCNQWHICHSYILINDKFI